MNKNAKRNLIITLLAVGVTGAVITAVVLVVLSMIKTTTKRSSGVLDLSGEYIPDYYSTTGVLNLWKQGYTGTGVRVLVIDSGINKQHVDITDVTTVGSPNDDEVGHGTHVSGIITGNANGEAMVGVAPDATVFSWDIQDGYLQDVMSALDWAINNRIDVVNMSFAFTDSYPSFRNKILEAHNNGIFLVCAAGNESSTFFGYPATYPEAISVGSVDKNNCLSYFSNYNSSISLVAPGEYILSDSNMSNKGLISMSGTSMSTPFITGFCSLLLEKYQDQNNGLRPTREQMVELARTTIGIPIPPSC